MSDAVPIEEKAAPEVGGSSPELSNSRERVVGALNSLLARLETAKNSGKLKNPEMQWHLNATQGGKEKTLGKEPPSSTLSVDVDPYHGYPGYSQAEGIPVDGLLRFADDEMDVSLSHDEIKQLEKQRQIILENSKYYRFYEGRRDLAHYEARVATEANILSKDPVMQEILATSLRERLGREPSPHELDVSTFLKAKELMNTRYELVIPDENSTGTAVEDTKKWDPVEKTELRPEEVGPLRERVLAGTASPVEQQQFAAHALEKYREAIQAEKDNSDYTATRDESLRKALEIAKEGGLKTPGAEKFIEEVRNGTRDISTFSEWNPVLKKAVLTALGQDVSATSTPPQNEGALPIAIAKQGRFKEQRPGTKPPTPTTGDVSMEESYPIYEAAGGLRNEAPPSTGETTPPTTGVPNATASSVESGAPPETPKTQEKLLTPEEEAAATKFWEGKTEQEIEERKAILEERIRKLAEKGEFVFNPNPDFGGKAVTDAERLQAVAVLKQVAQELGYKFDNLAFDSPPLRGSISKIEQSPTPPAEVPGAQAAAEAVKAEAAEAPPATDAKTETTTVDVPLAERPAEDAAAVVPPSPDVAPPGETPTAGGTVATVDAGGETTALEATAPVGEAGGGDGAPPVRPEDFVEEPEEAIPAPAVSPAPAETPTPTEDLPEDIERILGFVDTPEDSPATPEPPTEPAIEITADEVREEVAVETPTPATPADEKIRLGIQGAEAPVGGLLRNAAEKEVDAYISTKGFRDLLKLPKKVWWRWTKPRQIELIRQRLQKEPIGSAALKEAKIGGLDNMAQYIRDSLLTVERFAGGGINTDAKESQTILSTENPQQAALRKAIIDKLIKPIQQGTITTHEQAQQELAKFIKENVANPDYRQLLEGTFGPETNDYGEIAQHFATNLLEMGLKTKEQWETHHKSLEDLDQHIEISIGNARGYDTDQRSRIEKWLASARARQSKVEVGLAKKSMLKGIVLSPIVIGVSSALATRAVLSGMNKSSHVVGLTTLGAGAGMGVLTAAIRRRGETAEDMRRHQFEKEAGLGQENDKKGKLADTMRRMTGGSNRDELEKIRTRLNATTARSIIDGTSRDVVTGIEQRSFSQLLTSDNAEEVLRKITDINMRQRMGAATRTPLITYQDRALDLRDLELGKLDLEKHFQEITASMPPDQRTQMRTDMETAYNTRLMESRADMEGAFKRYQFKQSLKAGVFGGAVGLVGGATGAATIRGIREAMGTHSFTPGLENIPGLNKLTGEPHKIHEHMKALYENHKPTKVGDVTLTSDADHHVSITSSDGATVRPENWALQSNGNINIDGAIPAPLQENFTSQGFDVQHHVDNISLPFNNDTPLVPDNIDGRHIMVPQGSGWIHDSQDPTKWNLVVNGHPDQTLIHGASIAPDGTMSYDHATSLLGDNAVVSKEGILQDASTETHKVLGPEGDWSKSSTLIDHREWYANNTPYSDGNELKAYNSIFTTADGQKGVDWDASNMQLATQKGLIPDPINVQDVIRDRQLGMAFSLPNQQDHPLWFPADANGHVRLDPSSTLPLDPSRPDGITVGQASKIILNQNALKDIPDGSLASELTHREGVFNLGQDGKMGYAEFGRLTHTDKGTTTLQAFATGRGASPVPDSITITKPPVIGTIFTVNPHEVTIPHETIVLVPPTESENPFIPIPWVPRFPLEALAPLPDRDRPAYGGYENLSPRDKEFYRKRMSKRIQDDPNAKLDPAIEIPDYLDRQPDEYKQKLQNYLHQNGMLEPMDDKCEAVVCMPVYALGEGKVVENALNQYLLQVDRTHNKNAVNPEQLELLIFLNHPKNLREQLEQGLGHSFSQGAEERVRNGTPEKYDTEEVIRQFRAKHPELRIRIMKEEFETRPQWGKIIKPLYDAALLRTSKRPHPFTTDPLIITNDVDVSNLSPSYIQRLLGTKHEAQRTNSQLDGIVGKIDMPNHGYQNYPGFLLAERLFQFMDAQNRRKGGGAITQGRNTALLSSTYAAIGGVNSDTDAGGDTELGKMITVARNSKSSIRYQNSAWLETDPRRELEEWKKGVPLAYAWDSWGDMNMYGKGWKERIGTTIEDPSKIDKEFLEREVYFEMERWGVSPSSPEMVRSLEWLGFKPTDYHIGQKEILHPRGEKITVTTVIFDKLDNAAESLSKFVEEERWKKTDRKIAQESNPRVVPTNTRRPIIRTPFRRAPTPPPSTERTATTRGETPIPPAPARPESLSRPRDVVETINVKLATETSPTSSYEMTPEDLSRYIESIKLSVKKGPVKIGGKLQNINIRIDGDKIAVQGEASLLGTSRFNAELKIQAGRIVVVNKNIALAPTHSGSEGTINNKLDHIDEELEREINARLDPRWAVSGYSLSEGKVGVNFKKKTT